MGDGALAAMVEPALAIKEALQPGADDVISDGGITEFSESGIACLRAAKRTGGSVDGAPWCPTVPEGVSVGEVRITLHLNRLNGALDHG